MHKGPKTLKTSPSNGKISVTMLCNLNFSKPKPGTMCACPRTEESPQCKKQPFSRVRVKLGNVSQGGPQTVCLSRDWDTHGRTLFGIKYTIWGTTARVCPAKTHTWSLQKPRDFIPHMKLPSHPLSFIHILISHLSKQAIQITDFLWSNAQHIFRLQQETHASWAYFQYFEDILTLQWSKNRSGLIKIVQFHSCTDQLIYVLASCDFYF